eukprot:3998535-Prymnesium_polylepis.2
MGLNRRRALDVRLGGRSVGGGSRHDEREPFVAPVRRLVENGRVAQPVGHARLECACPRLQRIQVVGAYVAVGDRGSLVDIGVRFERQA